MNSFQGFRCCVSIGGQLSEFIEATVGLHQGAPFSMLGYCLLDEMLLKPLVESPHSIHIGKICVSAPAYADDLTLNAISVKALQQLLNIVNEFASNWRLRFNPNKCKYLVYDQDKPQTQSSNWGMKRSRNVMPTAILVLSCHQVAKKCQNICD